MMTIHIAVLKNKLHKISRIIASGQDDVDSMEDGVTPLYLAVAHGNLKMVNKLIKCGADVNKNCASETPLVKASKEGYISIIKLLLNTGVDINASDKQGWTSLHHAVYNEHEETVATLITSGCNRNLVSVDLQTPLWLAARKGNLQIVQMLMYNKDVEERCRREKSYAHSFHKAKEAVLSKWRAIANTSSTPTGKDAMDERFVLDKPCLCNLSMSDVDQKTALDVALDNNFPSIAMQLVHAGADSNVADCTGTAPIHKAVRCSYIHIVKQMISCGAGINLQSRLGTPLQLAISAEHHGICSLLIDSGCNICTENKWGYTLVMDAITHGCFDLAKLLLYHGARVSIGEYETAQSKSLRHGQWVFSRLLQVTGGMVVAESCRKLMEKYIETVSKDSYASDLNLPLSLQDTCRIVIRMQLNRSMGGASITKSVQKLPLPNKVINFIDLKDILE